MENIIVIIIRRILWLRNDWILSHHVHHIKAIEIGKNCFSFFFFRMKKWHKNEHKKKKKKSQLWVAHLNCKSLNVFHYNRKYYNLFNAMDWTTTRIDEKCINEIRFVSHAKHSIRIFRWNSLLWLSIRRTIEFNARLLDSTNWKQSIEQFFDFFFAVLTISIWIFFLFDGGLEANRRERRKWCRNV